MQALKGVDPEIAERVRIAGRRFLQLTPAVRREEFKDRLERHSVKLDTLASSEQRLHYLAQQAVVAFRVVGSPASGFTIWDAVLTILCDAHGGAHGSELLRGREFNKILSYYYP